MGVLVVPIVVVVTIVVVVIVGVVVTIAVVVNTAVVVTHVNTSLKNVHGCVLSTLSNMESSKLLYKIRAVVNIQIMYLQQSFYSAELTI